MFYLDLLWTHIQGYLKYIFKYWLKFYNYNIWIRMFSKKNSYLWLKHLATEQQLGQLAS